MQNMEKRSSKGFYETLFIKLILSIFISIFLLSADYGVAGAEICLPQTAISKDGSVISYEVYGEGETTLIFVHGWSCDSRYWREQVPFFSKQNKVVLVDLAGHGHSSAERVNYTMRSFGEDVRAVVEAIGSTKVILIGHSMGGAVIAETARLIPDKVIALIGIDTFDNIEYPLTEEEKDKILAPLEKDFRTGCSNFVNGMISNSTAQSVRSWIVTDMSAAPSAVAISANHGYFDQYITGEAADIFKEVRQPVYCVSGDLWPINYEANRRHMSSFNAKILKGAAHFLMIARPKEFNMALNETIIKIIKDSKQN
ncbi:alpha/beta fold hydrolase [Maridesulfovibrio hydrothermalis]|uniref:Alpha/beta hydrolase fold protein n=1 Tax=Maridesulfovibrio hydrothermalis AM13 = DSM 14728 TaxID=1121451 RepID=L0RCK7_9BACT|nr:alpha/beta hydrolase [Maridesulfovibrio hydrothermalis]CCO23942.1 Alpha/beta hydrolase fold protein [Maridesulfovibrio hydrothermalis AM13 = DSM 14728]